MKKLIVAGCGTEVGKTIVSAILVHALKGEYWKAVESGGEEGSDTSILKALLPEAVIHTPVYSLKAPLAPHHAAKLEHLEMDHRRIVPPQTESPLIMEMAGGILVPLNRAVLMLDLFGSWKAEWIVVSKHYLGSINHTLLTLEALKRRNIDVKGLIFNGEPDPESEEAVLQFSKVPCIGRLLPEPDFTKSTMEKYARAWKQNLLTI